VLKHYQIILNSPTDAKVNFSQKQF